MNDTPEFEKESKAKLQWYIENFPSPHPFFKPAMAALEKERGGRGEFATYGPTCCPHPRQQRREFKPRITGGYHRHTDRSHHPGIQRTIEANREDCRSEWALLNKPTAHVTAQTVCREVDTLRAALVLLYGKCPNTVDTRPLRDAIEKLDETRNHRFGNLIGSQTEIDHVSELMEAALRAVASMVPDAVGNP